MPCVILPHTLLRLLQCSVSAISYPMLSRGPSSAGSSRLIEPRNGPNVLTDLRPCTLCISNSWIDSLCTLINSIYASLLVLRHLHGESLLASESVSVERV